MYSAREDFRPLVPTPTGFSVSDMDEAVEPITERDPGHRCPICGGETELVSIGFVHRDGEKHQVEVSPKRRRCAVLDCHGHGGLDEPADG